ncbi:MAG: hypothetical protein ABI315_09585 [Bacteroidia bacterium]
MTSIWLFIAISFEIATFIVSVIYSKTLIKNKLSTFPYFLLFILLGEITGILLGKIYHKNIAFYNIFTSLQMAYYLVLIHKSINSLKGKRCISFCLLFFIITTLINYFFIQNIDAELASYTFTIGCLLITIGGVYFFYELLHSDEIENYATYPQFWIILGLFIFYTCNIPYMSVYNYLSKNYLTICNAYFKIIEILSYIMYSFFIIGIVCNRKKKLFLH